MLAPSPFTPPGLLAGHRFSSKHLHFPTLTHDVRGSLPPGFISYQILCFCPPSHKQGNKGQKMLDYTNVSGRSHIKYRWYQVFFSPADFEISSTDTLTIPVFWHYSISISSGTVMPASCSTQAWLSSKSATGVSLAVDIFARTNCGTQFVCGKWEMGLPLNEIQNSVWERKKEREKERKGLWWGKDSATGQPHVCWDEMPGHPLSSFYRPPLIIRLVNILPRMQSYWLGA